MKKRISDYHAALIANRIVRTQLMREMREKGHMTLQEIGDACGGISRERVRQIIGNTGRRQKNHETDDSRAGASLL